MPTYQYTCTDCGQPLEAVQSFSDPSLTVCPSCGGNLRKVFSAVGVVFKGSGFYRTDSRSGAGKGDAAAKKDSAKGDAGSKTDSTGKGDTGGKSGSGVAATKTGSDSGSSGSSGGGTNGSSGSSSSGSSSSSTSATAAP